MTPQDVHGLILRICGYITPHSTRDFADVTKVNDLEMGDYPGLSRWAQSNHMNSWKWKKKADKWVKTVTWEEFDSECWLWRWKKEAMSQGRWEAPGSWEWPLTESQQENGKLTLQPKATEFCQLWSAGNKFSPGALRQKLSPTNILTLVNTDFS